MQPIKDTPDWLHDTVRVFDGEFAFESDKEKLVDVVLGLWSCMLETKDATPEKDLSVDDIPAPEPAKKAAGVGDATSGCRIALRTCSS